jgi:crotonobetainyl-CoA:carnitine CoA-transferase CaiB-like acyl-CoA transferase
MTSVAYAGTRVIEIVDVSAGVVGRCFMIWARRGAGRGGRAPLWTRLSAVQTWPGRASRVLAGSVRSAGDIGALLAGADVVITDLSPSRWDETFPPLEALVDAYPGLVVVDVTRFGRVGPYIDYLAPDLVVLALSGYLFMCGLNDREPLRLGVDLVDVMTGFNAAGGAMLGLHHARRTGQGQVVEVSALRTMLCSTMSFATSYSSQGIVRRRSSTRMVSVGIMLPCKDGHALVNTFRRRRTSSTCCSGRAAARREICETSSAGRHTSRKWPRS